MKVRWPATQPQIILIAAIMLFTGTGTAKSLNSPVMSSPSDYSRYTQGQKIKYFSGGHPKAKGINLSLKYPAGWQRAEGARPNIVQKFSKPSKDAVLRGCTLTIKELPAEFQNYDQAEVADGMFSETNMTKFLPATHIFLDGQRTSYDAQPGAWIKYKAQLGDAGFTGQSYGLANIFLYQNSLIWFDCQVGAVKANEIPIGKVYQQAAQQLIANMPPLDKEFEQYLPLFQLISNSIILPDKWIGKSSSERFNARTEGESFKPLISPKKAVFTTKGHPKSRGIELSIEYPSDWKADEFSRPTTIQSFTHELNTGINEYCILNIREMPADMKIIESGLLAEKAFSSERVGGFIPKSATILSSGVNKTTDPMEIPNGWVTFKQIVPDGVMYMYKHVFFYRDSVISLTSGIAAEYAQANSLDKLFDSQLPAYQAIANSLKVEMPPKSFISSSYSQYIKKMQAKVRNSWLPPKGEKANTVKTSFRIGVNGDLLGSAIVKSSGIKEFDKAALDAIAKAAPFDPLPSGHVRNSILVGFTFDYAITSKKP